MADRTFGNRTKNAIGVLTLTGAVLGFTAACGSDDEQSNQQVYCADANGKVVDDDLCDDDNDYGGGSYFFFVGSFGGNSYRPGDRISNTYINNSSTQRVNPSSSSARAGAGIPSSGHVATGSRPGGIGGGAVGGGS